MTRRERPRSQWLAALLLLIASAPVPGVKDAVAADPASSGKFRVYLGTYTGPKSRGVYLAELDPESGRVSTPRLAAESASPSFLAIHPSQRFLYSVNEVGDFEGKPSGSVTAFAIDADGSLKFLNSQPSGGGGPCHLVVDRLGKNVLVANYGGGSVEVIPIGTDGKLAKPSSFDQHTGTGTNPQRQEAPHAHSINLDAANRFAVAADLGLDRVFVYRFDAANGTLSPNTPPWTKVAPGAGPRHFAFHPDGRHAYVINEMHCTVTAFDYDAARGTLEEIQTLSTLPGPVKEGYSTAEVQVHPSGKFLYGSNRGHDTIAVFTIDPASGMLRRVGNPSTLGKTPRNFGIDPSGRILLAANQDSDTVVPFRINLETGLLDPVGTPVEVGMPVCVKFLATSGQ